MDDQSYLHIFPCIRNIKSFIYPVAFFTIYGYITNSQHHQLSVGLIGHLLEHCTGIAEVIASNFVHSAIFFKVVKYCIVQLIMSQPLPAAQRHNIFLLAVLRMAANCTLPMNSGTPSLSKQEHQSR